MYLQQLSLVNFKNIAEAQIDLARGVNCFVGDNGSGKTNLLDAIHYLSMCKSAFGLSDGQCIRHSSEGFVASGNYLTDADRTEKLVASSARRGTKKFTRGGKEYEKLSDHIGLVPVVLVTPADTALINESGEERRKYLNGLISQLDREYLRAMIQYNHLLAERNKLLKNQGTQGFDDILQVLDMRLVSVGELIHQRRRALLERLTPLVERYYRLLSDDREEVAMAYRSELNDRPFEELLQEAAQRDRICQHTTRGVHRDDIEMTIGGFPLRKYGSQGQQKSFLIALKLAQYEVVSEENPNRPLLLLDDIFDKLDLGRVARLIELVSSEQFAQIFITDCNQVRLERTLRESGCAYTLFQVQDGAVATSSSQP